MVRARVSPEALDPHLLSPPRRALKRPAAQISRDSFKVRRALSTRSVLASPLTTAQRPKKDNVAAARGDKPEKDELGDETEEDAMAVQEDGDIKDWRMCPYVLSSPHLGQRIDHGSIHVLTRAADQDEVVATRADELDDETVEQANRVQAEDGGREQGSGGLFPCSVCTLHISVGDTRKDQCTYRRDRLS